MPIMSKLQKDVDQDYKCLLVVNESQEANLTLYVYSVWSQFCLISTMSKIIPPKEKYFHPEKTSFKFELVAKFEDKRKMKKLLGPIKWDMDVLIKVTESLDIIKEPLTSHSQEKRVCLRKVYRRIELAKITGKLNLYAILGLDMEEIRKVTDNDGQKKAIKKAFREKIRVWHPDKNFGDSEIATEILVAKEILLDDERRARYHNEADYDKGWLSFERYKSIFWPECFTAEQNKDFWRRICLTAASVGLVVGGVALSVMTAGSAAPAAVVCGAIFGSGLTSAGVLAGLDTVSKKSMVDGCDAKSWLLKAGIGFVGGAVTGGTAVGVTAGMVGIGSAALESSSVSIGQYVAIGAASGSAGAASSSLASDAARALVDGEEVTLKDTLFHATSGALVGACAGSLSGLALGSVVARQTSAATSNLESDAVEQVLMLTGAKRLGNVLSQKMTRMVTESGTEAVMGTATQFLEERLDDSVENQHPKEHVVRGLQNVAGSVAFGAMKQSVGALASHAVNEVRVAGNVKEYTACERRTTRYKMYTDSNENRINWQSGKGSACYRPAEVDGASKKMYGSIKEAPDGSVEEAPDGSISYICEGIRPCKVTITYYLNSKECKHEVSGNKRFARIPSNARQIEVKFNVFKYDRFEKTWCKPYELHCFRYDNPPVRTFTISGILGWKAITRVSDEYHEETGEMD